MRRNHPLRPVSRHAGLLLVSVGGDGTALTVTNLILTFQNLSLILGTPSSLAIASLFYDHKFFRPFSLKDNFNWVYRNGHGGSREPFLQGYKAIYVINSVPIHFYGLFYGVSFLSFYSGIYSLTKCFLPNNYLDYNPVKLQTKKTLQSSRLKKL